jgi:hypothetical protein
VVQLYKMVFYLSSVMTVASRQLSMAHVRDFNGRTLFTVLFCEFAFEYGCASSVFSSMRTGMREMLESSLLKSWAPHDLERVRWTIL